MVGFRNKMEISLIKIKDVPTRQKFSPLTDIFCAKSAATRPPVFIMVSFHVKVVRAFLEEQYGKSLCTSHAKTLKDVLLCELVEIDASTVVCNVV